jgi:hypothetical protein
LPLLASACALVLTGCAELQSVCESPLAAAAITPAPSVRNVYHSSDKLPANVRRVAVLPLAADLSDPAAESGQQSLQPVLHAELARARMFDLSLVKPEQLKLWTGQAYWTAEEKLPPDFFQRLERELGCDAVLFSRLTVYRPYPPLLIGWDLKLIDCVDPHVRWSVDEVFDASAPGVAAAARRYHQTGLCGWCCGSEPSTALLSPRRFGQYSASLLVGALPTR